MIYKQISKPNLIQNTIKLKSCNKNKEIIAVVKADAYGHGVESVTSAIKGETSWFAVANINEAKNVRTYLCDSNIIVLGPQSKQSIEIALEYGFHITVNSVEELEKIVAVSKGREIKIHIKTNSGMNRFGIDSIKDFNDAQRIILTNNNLKFYGLFTHFSCVENKAFYLREQQIFACFLAQVRKEFSPFVHIGGSYCFTNPPTLFDFDAIRTGIALYGYGECAQKLKLKKVMKVFANIVSVRKIQSGQSIGYSRGFVASKEMMIATSPIGYADGVPRLMSNRINGKIGTKHVRQIGNVCMDALMFDISGIDLPKTICIFYDANVWAKKIGTNAYEILTNFRKLRER